MEKGQDNRLGCRRLRESVPVQTSLRAMADCQPDGLDIFFRKLLFW
jgi:hypothetical protein